MLHSLRRKLTPAGIAAHISILAILGTFVAFAPVAGLTGTAQAATGTITEYRPQGTPCDTTGTPGGCIVQTSATDPNGIVSDNGQIFYTDAGESVATAGLTAPDNQLGLMNVDGSGFTTYHEVPQGADTVGLAVDSASNLWAVDNGNASDDVFVANTVGGPLADIQLDPVSSTASAGYAPAYPTSIARGPDGRMWWTESGSGRIDAISTSGISGSIQCWVTTADPCSEYALPGGQAVGNTTTAVTEEPEDITAGPDGNMWATVDGSRTVDKITTSGIITQYATPGSNGGISGLSGIASGPGVSGTMGLWVTGEGSFATNATQADRPVSDGNGQLAFVSTAGVVTQIPDPVTATVNQGTCSAAPCFAPASIVAGPDDAMWMTDVGQNAIWRYLPGASNVAAGTWSEFPIPTPKAFSGNVPPTGITVGPDNNIWFTENNANLPPTANCPTVGGFCAPAALAKVEIDSFVSFNPAPLNFGTEALNTPVNKTIQVSNSFGSPLTVSGVAVTGTDASQFSIGSDSCSSTIPTSGCTISVTFTPTSSGVKSAGISITDTQGSTTRNDSVNLTGTGQGPPTLTPSSFTFPDQLVGTLSKNATFSISNLSGAALPVSGINLSGANPGSYRVVVDDCSGISVPNGSSCPIDVAFDPAAAGIQSATLVVTDAAGTQTSTLAGRGVAGVGPPPTGGPGGYWLDASDGGIFAYGTAGFYGSAGSIKLNKPIVGMARTPDGGGYWLVATDGGIFNYGDANFYGSTGAMHLNKPIVAMAPTPSGKGYWLVASDGGIFAFGDAVFHGSAGSIKLNKPIVGMAATADGGGYWLVATDGGIFNYGDAGFHGSAGGINLNKPIAGMAPTSSGNGYWLVATDGGIFTYGDAGFDGSAGSIHLNKPIVGMAPSLDGGGYYLVATDGGIFTYGDAGFHGSAGSINLNKPIVGMAVSS